MADYARWLAARPSAERGAPPPIMTEAELQERHVATPRDALVRLFQLLSADEARVPRVGQMLRELCVGLECTLDALLMHWEYDMCGDPRLYKALVSSPCMCVLCTLPTDVVLDPEVRTELHAGPTRLRVAARKRRHVEAFDVAPQVVILVDYGVMRSMIGLFLFFAPQRDVTLVAPETWLGTHDQACTFLFAPVDKLGELRATAERCTEGVGATWVWVHTQCDRDRPALRQLRRKLAPIEVPHRTTLALRRVGLQWRFGFWNEARRA